MSKGFGGLLISLSDFDPERITSILEFGSGTLTFALPTNYLVKGASCLSLVSIEAEKFEYLAVVTASSTRFDLEIKVQIGPVKKFHVPFGIQDLIMSLVSSKDCEGLAT